MELLQKRYPSTLRQRQISVEYVMEKKLEELDFLHSEESAKLLFRINNGWALKKTFGEAEWLLENYKCNFGDCFNKLRLVCDFAVIAHKLSCLFVSDGTLTGRFK